MKIHYMSLIYDYVQFWCFQFLGNSWIIIIKFDFIQLRHTGTTKKKPTAKKTEKRKKKLQFAACGKTENWTDINCILFSFQIHFCYYCIWTRNHYLSWKITQSWTMVVIAITQFTNFFLFTCNYVVIVIGNFLFWSKKKNERRK